MALRASVAQAGRVFGHWRWPSTARHKEEQPCPPSAGRCTARSVAASIPRCCSPTGSSVGAGGTPRWSRLPGRWPRWGFVVYVPNLPALQNDQIIDASLKALDTDLHQFAASEPAGRQRVSLFGVCAGASLAILAAEQPGLSGNVRAVAAIDPYASLRDLLDAATVGQGANARGVVGPFHMSPWAAWVIARSVAATLPEGAGRRVFLATLGPAPPLAPGPSPLAAFGRTPPPQGVGPAAAAWWRLLGNRRPRRFAALYDALPQRARRGLRTLSPVDGLRGLQAPLLIAAPVTDFAYPAGEAAALVAANHRGAACSFVRVGPCAAGARRVADRWLRPGVGLHCPGTARDALMAIGPGDHLRPPPRSGPGRPCTAP